MARNLAREEGFTLLELIVAVSFLAVGILGAASMQSAAIRGNAFAGGATQGTNYAADRAEKLGKLGWNDSNLTAGSHADPTPPPGMDEVRWEITDNWPLPNAKRVTVIARWTAYGIQRKVVVRTIIPRIL